MSADVVVALMMATPPVNFAVASGVGVLNKFSADPRTHEALLSAGAVGALVCALGTHAPDASVCAIACGALGNICSSKEGQATVLSGDALASIVTALRTHATSDIVCSNACAVMFKLTSSTLGSEAAQAASALAPVLAALSNHSANSNLCASASGVIYYMCFLPACLEEMLAASSAPRVLVSALSMHTTTNETVGINTCSAMSQIARRADGAAGLIAAGAIPHLRAVFEHFGGSQVRLALNLLGILLVGEAVSAA